MTVDMPKTARGTVKVAGASYADNASLAREMVEKFVGPGWQVRLSPSHSDPDVEYYMEANSGHREIVVAEWVTEFAWEATL